MLTCAKALDFAAVAVEFAGVNQASEAYSQATGNAAAGAALEVMCLLPAHGELRSPVCRIALTLCQQLDVLVFHAKVRGYLPEAQASVTATASLLAAAATRAMTQGVG